MAPDDPEPKTRAGNTLPAQTTGQPPSTREDMFGKFKKLRHHAWKEVRSLSTLIAIGALMVAYLTWRDQRNVDNQANTAARYALARGVSTYQQPDEPDVVVIQNAGFQPVYNLYLRVSVTLRNSAGKPSAEIFADGRRWFSLSVLPPCAETAIKFDKPAPSASCTGYR
jgi:hypothetical protein